MTRKLLPGLLMLFWAHWAAAIVLPRDGGVLNCRLVGLSFDEFKGADSYRVEIANSDFRSDSAFAKNIAMSVSLPKGMTRKIAEVPFWGCDYTWRVVYVKKSGPARHGALHHFTTIMNNRIDTGNFRLRILDSAKSHTDCYVYTDGIGVMYDLQGRPVWYSPEINGFGGYVANLRFTSWGTITFAHKHDAYEADYEGHILRTLSDKDGSGVSRHNGLRLTKDGHYMELADEFIMCKAVVENDTAYMVTSNDGEAAGFRMGRFGIISEYDGNNTLVWRWRSLDYLVSSDLAYCVSADSAWQINCSEYSFCFASGKDAIYVVSPALNKLFVVGYPSGEVTNVYGGSCKPGVSFAGSGIFDHAQSVQVMPDGRLLYYNNSAYAHAGQHSKIEMIRLPQSPRDTFARIWEYECPGDSLSGQPPSPAGSVAMLPDSCLFVYSVASASELFIVNYNKDLLWRACAETFNHHEERWGANVFQSAGIICRDDLERGVWDAETRSAAQ